MAKNTINTLANEMKQNNSNEAVNPLITGNESELDVSEEQLRLIDRYLFTALGLNTVFKAAAKEADRYGSKQIVFECELNPKAQNYQKEFNGRKLSEEARRYFRLRGFNTVYDARLGVQTSRSKEHAGKEYLGISVTIVDGITLHSPLTNFDCEGLCLLGFMQRKQ